MNPRSPERLLGLAFWLIATFMVVEVIAGYLANSLTLLADAGHMFLDAAALGLAWGAARLSHRDEDDRLTYGYHRYQVLVAFINGLTLVGLSVWILIEAIGRIQQPPEVLPIPALAVAVVGLAVNLVALKLLHGGEGLNVRSAMLHVLGDILGSVAAIVASGLIWAFGWLVADPILALVVVMILLRGAWRVLRESTLILVEGTPRHIDLDEVRRAVSSEVDDIVEVHHLHAWSLTENKPLLTMHANVGERADTHQVVSRIKVVLLERFGIDHSTIQIECGECPDDEADCGHKQSQHGQTKEVSAP